MRLLTEPKYILNMNDNGNYFSRNSDCFSGGDELTIFVTNPREEEIIGIEITLTPFVPNQNLGLDQEFPQIKIEEEFATFGNLKGIMLAVALSPELSYKIKWSFKTDFGLLSQSEEVVAPGEFENMMQKVGCYVRNDYVLNTTSVYFGKVVSSIKCAKSCFESKECKEGWKYEIGTNQCYFYNNLYALEYEEYRKFQPGALILSIDFKIGWASGHKSCSVLGKIRIFFGQAWSILKG